jgi:hypothetical protein
VVEIAVVKGGAFEWPQVRGRLIPLLLVFRQVLVEGRSKRLQQIRECPLLAIAEREAERKFLSLANIQLSGQSDVSIAGALELPIHPEVVVEVGPAVARTNIAAGEVQKGDRRAHRHPFAAFLSHQDALAVSTGDVAVITGSTALQVWCAQSEELQIRERCLVFAGDAGTLEQARKVWVSDDVLRNGIAAIGVRIGAAIAKHMVGDPLHLDG